MDKKKLKLLEIEQLPAVIEVGQLTDNQKFKYAFVAKRLTVGGERILEVTFFSLATMIAKFRIFFNQKTFVNEMFVPQRKWSTATLTWLSDWDIHGGAICANSKSASAILNHFKAKDMLPYQVMADFQKSLRKKQLQTRHKKETDQIDAKMKEVRALPRDFTKWVNEVALDFSRYIYYRRKTKKLIEGYCTSCKADVTFHITKDTLYVEVRHGNREFCPLCKKPVTFKAIGKTTTLVDKVNAAYIQKTNKGFLIRYFSVVKRYRKHYRMPELTVDELVRNFYEPVGKGKWRSYDYEYTEFKQTHVRRWCISQDKIPVYIACLYSRKLQHTMSETPWAHSSIWNLAENLNRFHIHRYLCAYLKHPVYEYLIKCRLYRIVAENIKYSSGESYLKLDAVSVPDILGVDRHKLKQLQRLNGTVAHLRIIRNSTVPLTDDLVKTLLEMDVDSLILAELLEFTTPHKIIKYAKRIAVNWKVPNNSWAYRRNDTYHSITEYWRDYLTNCKMLEYDLKDDFILFPRDLKAAHDNVMKLYQRKRDEIQDRIISEMYVKLLESFGFESKDFFIRPPTSTDEIVLEGHTLHHCVHTGSYIDKMAQGKLYLFFIRRVDDPDEPFYTVEVEGGLLRQCRGANNCDMTPEVKKFVDIWKKSKLSVA